MVPADQLNAHVPGLEEGQEYEFRVVPVNDAGPGEPSEETPRILCKARRGTPFRTHVCHTVSPA